MRYDGMDEVRRLLEPLAGRQLSPDLTARVASGVGHAVGSREALG